jgi:hypothetical protein
MQPHIQSRAYEAIQAANNHLKIGKTSIEYSQRLVDDSADVLAPALDKKVLRLSHVIRILRIIRMAHQ